MATPKKVRTNIALSPETKEILERLAAAMDISVARLGGGILDDAASELDELATSLEKAKADPASSFSNLQLALIKAQRHALDTQADLLGQLDKSKPKS